MIRCVMEAATSHGRNTPQPNVTLFHFGSQGFGFAKTSTPVHAAAPYVARASAPTDDVKSTLDRPQNEIIRPRRRLLPYF